MKRFTELLGVCVVGVAVVTITISCNTTKKIPSEEKQQPVEQPASVEQPEQPAKVPEKAPALSKTGFVEQLQMALKTGSADDALKLYDTLPAEYADDFDLLFLKASLLMSAKRLDEADALCKILHTRKPDNTDVMELAAMIAKARGDTAGKNAQLSAILAKDPNNAGANIELADDAILERSYRKAQMLYAKALTKEPDNAEALVGYGETCYFLEDDDRAKDTFNKAIEKDPENDMAYYYLGKLAYAQNKYKTAADNVEKAIALNGGNYDYYLDYGMDLRFLGKFDDAEKAWTKAIELEPDYFLSYVYRAGLYDEEEKLPEALADYRTIVKLNPEYYFAYESIGVLALHDKNWTEAREAFTKCREINKDNVSYPLMITYCYYKEGDKINAKKFSDSVLRTMDRDSVEYLMLRAFHDETDKLPLVQRISEIDNSNKKGKMYFYLGLLYDMFGGIESAAPYYTKVVQMNSPMFFEYRLAEWSVGKVTTDGSN